MKNILTIIFLSLVLPFHASTQIVSQEEYRTKVLEYNQDIKKAQAYIEAAQSATKSAKTGHLPKIDINGNYSYQFFPPDFLTAGLEPHGLSTDITLAQNVFSGNIASSQIEAGKIKEEMAKLGETNTRENILYAADVNYWNASANQEFYSVAQQFHELIERLYQVVNQRYLDGLLSRTDLLMVETRKKEAELQINQTAKNYQLSLQNMLVMAGLDPNAPIKLDSIQYPIAIPKEVPLDQALLARSDYQMALKQTELASQQVRTVRGKFQPSLVIGVQETFGTSMINLDNETRFNTIAFAKLKIPVFDWNNRRHSVSQAKIEVVSADLDRSKKMDQISLELNNAKVNVNRTQEQISIARQNLTIASENLKLNTISYNEGRLPILDVLSAQISWLQAYTSVVSANFQNKVAIAEYNKALGLNLANR